MREEILCPSCHGGGIRQYAYPEGVIFICPACRLQWSEVAEAESTGPMLLTDINKRYMNPAALDFDRYGPYLEFFSRLPPKTTLRILDVGCGSGAFIGTCLRRGHDAWGIEIDESLKKVMPPEVAARVAFAPAESGVPYDRPFDVITFWDSFEHISDAFDVLNAMRPMLKEGGKVYVRVNNSTDLYNAFTNAALMIAPGLGKAILKSCFNLPQHRWNFCRQAMEPMLNRHGWDIIHFAKTDTPVDRFTSHALVKLVINTIYLANKCLGEGKIGEYEVVPARRGAFRVTAPAGPR